MEESKWSQLPGDILRTISKRLNTRIDTLRLRSICSSWRSSVPAFKSMPSCPITLPFPISSSKPLLYKNRHVLLSQSTVYILISPQETSSRIPRKPWVFRAEELTNGKFHPLGPLSTVWVTNKAPWGFPKVLNLLDFRVFEITRAFCMNYVENCVNSKPLDIVTQKAVVSATSFTTDGDDFEVVTINDGKLAFIRSGDEKWSLIDNLVECVDVVYHKGKFYAVDRGGKTSVIGADMKAVQVGAPLPSGGGQFKRLVKSGEDLYLFDRVTHAETPIDEDDYYESVKTRMDRFLKIYRLKEKEKEWERVPCLADKLFFIGDDFAYALSSKDFAGLRGNCVYFSEEGFTGQNRSLGELFTDTGVYNMDNHTCGPLACFKRHSMMFWPPPAWVKANRHLGLRQIP